MIVLAKPEEDFGDFPDDFEDPVRNGDLPWVVEPQFDDPIPLFRLHPGEEPSEVEPEDNGQDEKLHPDLRGRRMPEDTRFVPPAISGINLQNYSQNARQKGWGAPCAARRATIVLTFARVTVDVRVAELAGLIMRANERQGYMYRKADTGAYNCRMIAGTNVWSNHAWGLAIDQNWQTNPYRSPLRTDMPVWLRDRWNRYGFAWGGDYARKKDAMHHEAMGTPAQMSQALVLARRELAGTGAIPGDGVLKVGDTGPQVEALQRVLNAWYPSLPALVVDGDFGPATEARVRYFQERAGLDVDGVAGPQTLRALGLL